LTAQRDAPRSIEYFVLRVCERIGISEHKFRRMMYAEQVRLVAYEALRQGEEVGAL